MTDASFKKVGVPAWRAALSLPSRPTAPPLRIAVPVAGKPAHLRQMVDRRLCALVPHGAKAHRLNAAMRYALLAPGKRFRPLLVLFSSVQCGARDLGALDAACAVEMVHAASLILDDLPCMDDAELRRGQPTVHRRFGEDIAILAAVGLLNRAFGVLARIPCIDPEARARLVAELSDGIGPDGLLGGQEADLHDRELIVRPAEIGRLYHAKTGILLEKAVEIGALIGGACDDDLGALRQFALHLGLAFQTLDDLMDMVENAAVSGKDAGKDAGKRTIVDIAGAEGARTQVVRWINEACLCLDRVKRGPEPLGSFVRSSFAMAAPC